MKLLITTLTIIFISFGANASSNIETLYKYCKIYQNNGFKFKSTDQLVELKSVICQSEIRMMVHLGDKNCAILQEIYKNSTDKIKLEVFAKMAANGREQSISQVIMTFINFAEKNPQLWKDKVILHSKLFLGNKFPCKLKK